METVVGRDSAPVPMPARGGLNRATKGESKLC
jgi:hypothetical protein